MNPYYADEHVTLYNAHCLEMEDWGWQAGDVLVTDPPYGINYNSGARRETLAASIAGDENTDLRDAVLELWENQPALVFGTWRIPRPAKTRMVERIYECLNETYLPAGVQFWLDAMNRNLQMQRPEELIASGRAAEVLAEAERLSGGAW